MELWARQPVPLLVSRAPPPFPAVPSPVTGAPFLSRSSAVPLPFLCRSSQKEGREGGGGGSPAASLSGWPRRRERGMAGAAAAGLAAGLAAYAATSRVRTIFLWNF